jgi:microcystin-dependent protein
MSNDILATPVDGQTLMASPLGPQQGLYPSPWTPFAVVDALGDLLVGVADDTIDRLPIGSNGQLLTVDSAQPLAMKWANAPAPAIPLGLLDGKGDLIVASANDTAAKLGAGTDFYVLTADSSAPLGVRWGQAAAASFPVDTVIAAATRIIANMTTVGDAQPAWRVLGSGQMEWGAGGASPTDVTLWRSSAGLLNLGTTAQKGSLRIYGGNSADILLYGTVAAEAQPRWRITAGGVLSWSDGINPVDTTLQRVNAGVLYLGTSAQKGALRQFGAAAADILSDFRVTTDAQPRFYIRADGQMAWGDGTAAQDTFLYRAAGATLALGTPTQRGRFRFYGSNAFDIVLDNHAAAEAIARFSLVTNGQMMWGDGTNPQDTTLQRAAAGVLSLGTTSQKGRLRTYGGTTGDLVFDTAVTTDAFTRWYVRADGFMNWGPGNAANDTRLYRNGVGILALGDAATKGRFQIFGSAASDTLLDVYVTSDTNPRFYVRADGYHAWGDGTNPQDVVLYRSGADQLALAAGDAFRIWGTIPTSVALDGVVTGDTSSRFVLRTNGQMAWGPGNAATDVDLLRGGADRLKTNDLFDATTMGLATKVKAGTPVDADWAVAPPDGTTVADSSASKLWTRIGGAWVAMGGAGGGAAAPTGSVSMFAGSVAPTGWVICDGTAKKRSGTDPDGSDYTALFAVIGTTYGTGDGSTTFNLPDLRGRIPVGLGTHTDVNALGKNDGVAVGSRRPAHAHTNGLTFNGSAGNTGTESADHSHLQMTSDNAGSPVQTLVRNVGAGNLTVGGGNTGGRSAAHTHAFTPAGTIGGTIGQAGMTDSDAYLVLVYIIKL